MKKLRLSNLPTSTAGSEILTKSGFVAASLNKLTSMSAGQTITFNKMPMFFMIQNLTSGHPTSIFLAFGTTVVPISNNTQLFIAINSENPSGKISITCTSAALSITNNFSTAQSVRMIGLSF